MEQEFNSEKGRVSLSGEAASGRDASSSSLVVMLVVGLILIVIGAIAIMTFV